MNKINLNFNKKILSTTILFIVTAIFIYSIYFVNNKIKTYRTSVLDDYKKLAELEKEMEILNIYNQISSKDSIEFLQLKKYVLSSDRKDVLGLIDQLDIYTKKVGLVEDGDSPIVSVETRENTELTQYNAADLIINIKVTGSEEDIDNFINILNNLPLVSFIEKIDMKFGEKNSAAIVLVIYQTK